MNPVNLAHAFARIDRPWTPRVAAELNGQQVKLVRLEGAFVWHHHEHEDELFLVIDGAFRMQFRDREVTVNAGEFIVVPRGVEHRPVADAPCQVLLLEPAGTLNTGNVRDALTVDQPEKL
jgi:mannose-6-phosphate isomerase-like protein (cupin superfamily)